MNEDKDAVFQPAAKCDGCPVYKYCGTMVSSIRLCRSIHKDKEDGNKKT